MVAIYDVLKASKGIHVDDTFAELWGRKLSNAYTVATYTGALPATLTGTKADYLESYKIYGNTEQDGTPTPENPIMPSGCGVKTENLFDINSNWARHNQATTVTVNGKSVTIESTWYAYIVINVERNTTLTLNFDVVSYTVYRSASVYGLLNGDINNSDIITPPFFAHQATFSTGERDQIAILFYGGRGTVGVSTYTNIILNEGSTSLSYEPYGYKLPILSNSTVTNIYLGEVETTRRIKKLVLTGEENITLYTVSTGNLFRIELPVNRILGQFLGNGLCSHYRPVFRSADRIDGTISGGNASVVQGTVDTVDDYATVTDFKSYLAAQYANGTPVTVWYVLAEPKAGIVNEPLMKIRNYADTIDSTQSVVRVPTTAGETTISWAGEGLAPSEVELTYRKRKGQ